MRLRRAILVLFGALLAVVGSAGPSTAASVSSSGLRHDTFSSYYRSPFGAVPAGTAVTLRFRTAAANADSITLRVYRYDAATDSTTGPIDTPMSFLEHRVEGGKTYDVYGVTLPTPTSPSILYYKFRAQLGRDVAWYSDDYQGDFDTLHQGGTGAASKSEPFPAFQISVYDPSFATPSWLQNANVYEIFVDRFRNGDPSNDYCRPDGSSGCPVFYGSTPATLHPTWNERMEDARTTGFWNRDFFGGDLKGIQDKLGYLQRLGIDALYLTPIFMARSNHRYDTDDYLHVDPALGGDAALASLVQAMDARGMHLILDGVFNHASSDSLYFDRYHRYASDGACESLGSPFRAWFQFLDDTVPCGSADYVGWAGFDTLPAFDHTNPAVRDFFYRGADSVLAHWGAAGAAGWRFDTAADVGHAWWHDLRAYAKSRAPGVALVGEVWPDASSFLLGDQLDSVMNYRFRKNVIGFVRTSNWSDDNEYDRALTPSMFDHALRAVREDYPSQATAAMLNLLDSHDTNRALFVYTENADTGLLQAKERLELAALFQFTYVGAPMVYYGDEVAVNAPALARGRHGPEHDPYTRAPYPWSDQSGNVDIYGPPDEQILAWYSRLAHLRARHPALRSDTFLTLLTGDSTARHGDDDVYAYARVGPGESAVVALNKGSVAETAAVPVAGLFPDGTTLRDALSGASYRTSQSSVEVTLPPRTGVLLFRS